MHTPRFFLVVALVVGLSSLGTSSFGDDNRRDGNWWFTQESASKIDYLVGFVDGIHLGLNFATWGIIKKDKEDPALSKALNSYQSYTNQYLANVTVGQMAKGLDDFYGDYRNLRIKTSDAVWVVLRGISGDPKDEIEHLVENARKNAARD